MDDDARNLEEIRALMDRAAERSKEGKGTESNEALLEALEVCNQRHGAFHSRTHTVQTVLAFNYRAQGRYKDSESLDKEVLDRRQELLGDDHPETAISMNNLALDLKGQGRIDEALDLEVTALDTMVRVVGEESQLTMTSMNNLANSYANHSRFREAAELHERILRLYRSKLRSDDSRIYAAMDLLGVDYRNLGQVSRAVELQEKAVQEANTHLGGSDQTTIKCMINLADSHQERNNAEGKARAVSLLEDAIHALPAEEEEDTPLTIGVKNNLAVAYTKVGRMQDARPLLVACHEWNKRVLGEDSPRTQASSRNLAWILEELGETLMGE
ncbi:hypothetical protein BJY04DRAFT_184888 [Aspergillus karnatakaensis]|uniref:TPR domain protein n=1 Tax=Aspergillus karnatakaensis TaxID=1810916 RepID=UPI003CCDA782